MGNNPAPEAKNPFGEDGAVVEDNEATKDSEEANQQSEQTSNEGSTEPSRVNSEESDTPVSVESASSKKQSNDNDSEESFATASEGSDEEAKADALADKREEDDLFVTQSTEPLADQQTSFLDPLQSGLSLSTEFDDLDELFGDKSQSIADKELKKKAEEEEKKKREEEEKQRAKEEKEAARKAPAPGVQASDLFGGLLGSGSPATKKTANDLFGFDSAPQSDPIFGKGGDTLFGGALGGDLFNTPRKSTADSAGSFAIFAFVTIELIYCSCSCTCP